MSSVSLLMGVDAVESNSGTADARAAVTWPSTEVAARTDGRTDGRTDRRHAMAIPRFALKCIAR